MLIQVDLTLAAPEHPKDVPLEAKRHRFAGGSAGGFACSFAVGCVTWTLDRVTGWDEMGWAWCWPVDIGLEGTVDEIAAVAAANANCCTEIDYKRHGYWSIGINQQSERKWHLHFKLTLRSSDTVHVSICLIGSNFFLLRNESRTSHCNLSKNWNSSPNEIH